MATIDLGKVAFVWKGTYASGTTYESKDVVQYTDSGETSSYIYVNASSASGQTPSTSGTVNTTYWAKMAGGTSLSVGNNKIITTDASGNVSSLALGTAGQALKVNSGATGYEFGTISSGAFSIAEFKSFNMQTETHSGSTHTSYRLSSGSGTLTITPTATTDLLHFNFTMNVEGTLGGYYGQAIGMQTSNSGWTSTTGDAMLVINLGEHAQGMGSGNDTERYQHLVLNKMVTASDLGMSAGTTYHFVPYILCHNPAGQIKTAKDASNSNNIGHGRFEIMRYTAN
jgi:hypothetical protein